MINLPISPDARRLTEEEKKQFRAWGYIKNLPVFDKPAIPVLQQRFKELAAMLPEDVHMSRVNHWHKANRYVYNLCRTPTILDYVEDLLARISFSGERTASQSSRTMRLSSLGIKIHAIGHWSRR